MGFSFLHHAHPAAKMDIVCACASVYGYNSAHHCSYGLRLTVTGFNCTTDSVPPHFGHGTLHSMVDPTEDH